MAPFHKFLLALTVVVSVGFVVQWNTLRIWTARGGWIAADDLVIVETACRAGRRSTQKLDCTVSYRPVAGGEIETYQMYVPHEGARPQQMWRSRGDAGLVAPDLAVTSLPTRLPVLYLQFGLNFALILFGLGWAALRYGWFHSETEPATEAETWQRTPAPPAPPMTGPATRGFGRRGVTSP
ncbi:hypothetical protein [Prosthecodimorpha staleyi]|uniref:Uncharacterized protein n=1 Tax=Prosthecodimorpha staleyi TaxID=2840188 RepID=A0A947GAX6_9HYPH|nr:hypothetical protein [Prosthecodimorpha staleyi]MBT9289608.1 hypothetical protein [Prosthecodimorpha staleyi]